jgi:hypothetical protein
MERVIPAVGGLRFGQKQVGRVIGTTGTAFFMRLVSLPHLCYYITVYIRVNSWLI